MGWKPKFRVDAGFIFSLHLLGVTGTSIEIPKFKLFADNYKILMVQFISLPTYPNIVEISDAYLI